MGLFSAIAKVGSKVGRSVFSAGRTAAKSGVIPGLATAYTAYDLGKAGLKAVTRSGGASTPPTLPGMPGLPSMANGVGPPGAPAGMMAAPQDVYYQPIIGQNVTQAIRCFPGYVLVNYPAGTTAKVCMLKAYARSMGLWKPAPKPPISVKDWRALGRADRTIRKLQKIETKAKRIANWKSPTKRSKSVPASYTVIDEGSGSANLKVISTGRKK